MTRILFPLAILALAATYGLVAFGFPQMGLQEGFGPGFFPNAIAIIVALLAVWEVLVRVGEYRRRTAGAEGGPDLDDQAEPALNISDLTSAAIVIAAVIATVIAIPIVGLVPAGTAMVFALSIVMGTRPLWKGLLIAVLTSGAIYLTFAKGFNVIFAF